MHQHVTVEQQGLDRALPGQVQPPLQVPHVPGVAERLRGVAGRELPPELVDEEESRYEQEFSDQWRTGRCVRLRFRFCRLGAGIHPPAPSLTVVRAVI
ncbi:hypothetical protein SFUMM280S_11378 [Streptomyces fumanus]